jgi:hypothetical protein
MPSEGGREEVMVVGDSDEEAKIWSCKIGSQP